jgi:GNAT superfamily N-acetyltransferase
MSDRVFTNDYSELLKLDDGSKVRLRLVRPEDGPLLEAGFERLSAQSRYQRFFAPRATLTPGELVYLTHVDGENHFALGALSAEGGDARGLGIGRFVRLAGRPDCAEPAITVADEAQGKGLGRALLERLTVAAVERGVRTFCFEVLTSNEPMRKMIEGLAPAAAIVSEGDVMHIEVPLPADAHFTPEAHGLLHRFLALAAEGAILVRRAFDWVAQLPERLESATAADEEGGGEEK